MPQIYSTDYLKEHYADVQSEHPNAIILLQNGPMIYAWNKGARAVCKARGWNPIKAVRFAAANLDMTTKLLLAAGYSVVECELA
jgi:hypothetical protein